MTILRNFSLHSRRDTDLIIYTDSLAKQGKLSETIRQALRAWRDGNSVSDLAAILRRIETRLESGVMVSATEITQSQQSDPLLAEVKNALGRLEF